MIDPPRSSNGSWIDPPNENAEIEAASRMPDIYTDNNNNNRFHLPHRPQWLDLGLITGVISLLISMGSTFWGWVPKTAVMEVQINNQQSQIEELRMQFQSFVNMKILEAELRGKFEERLKALESNRQRQ